MSKLEGIKVELSFHEKILFAAVAIMITLVGWTAANYLVVKSWLLFMALLAIVGISIFIVYQYRIIKKLIKELIDV
ncbi:hypothetical protein [Methylobacter tundripaludum]|uniref:hypothetical protein n=1 Tax=Methylobacter tundripaludum TaxID=173365 RepID=UPI0004868B33|nr:hypothetical protein [Methylobacter tundripaludum]